MGKPKFTAKQQAFINHYLITLNGTEAARRAEYQGSDNTLGVVAHDNLRNPKIRAEIDRRLSKLAMSADEALYRMTQIARGDLSKIETAEDAGPLLKKHKVTKNKDGSKTVEFELYPADAALRDILKIHGKYGPLGTDDDPIQHRVKFIDYGLNTDDSTD